MIGNTKQFFYNQLNENNDGIIILCRLEVKGEEMHVANRKKIIRNVWKQRDHENSLYHW